MISFFPSHLVRIDMSTENFLCVERVKTEANESKTIDNEIESYTVCHVCGYKMYYDEKESHSISHMSYILPHLYLGSKINGQSCEVKYFNINHIIIVARGIAKIYDDKIKCTKYDWDDYFIFDISTSLDNTADQIHDEIMRGNNVLIHCAQGISRSATVVIGYLMKYNKMSYSDAYQYVKAARSCIDPNPSFIEQLKRYEETLTTRVKNDQSTLMNG